jgi:hypothetical protein
VRVCLCTQKRKRAVGDPAQAVVLGREDGSVLVVSVAKGGLAFTLSAYCAHTRTRIHRGRGR